MTILDKLFPRKKQEEEQQQKIADLKEQIDRLLARVEDLESRVTNLESEIADVASTVHRGTTEFKDFKNKTVDDLNRLLGENEKLRSTCESLVNRASRSEDRERAQALLKRLRNHKTRMEKSLTNANAQGAA